LPVRTGIWGFFALTALAFYAGKSASSLKKGLSQSSFQSQKQLFPIKLAKAVNF
jgi:hypothetical protein